MITQKLKPNRDLLKLRDVEIAIDGNEPKYAEHKITVSSTVPTVFYYNAELPTNYIKKIVVDSNKFLPMCYIIFDDVLGIMHDVGFPTDNAKLTIILPSQHPNLANIFMEFKIQDFDVEYIRNSTAKRIHLWGICNVDNLLIKKFEAHQDTSTYDIMKKVAQDAGLGLMSNVDTSSDKMSWLNPGMPVYKFLQDTINKAWVGETGYIWGFVDFYYNLNYIDLEKSLSQDIKEIKWIPASTVDNTQATQGDQEVKLIEPLLSNEGSLITSNTYFSGEKIINRSTNISLERGYIRNVHYYDVDGNWEDKAGAYKVYALDTITTSGNNETTIYLKGEPGDTSFYTMNQGYLYKDKIDTKNMYPDYLWAMVQNEENLYDLQKISLQITLPTPNFNIRRFEKIRLLFVNHNVSPQGTQRNIKLNGEWLVTGVSYEWNGSAMAQFVNLVKRELTVDEI